MNIMEIYLKHLFLFQPHLHKASVVIWFVPNNIIDAYMMLHDTASNWIDPVYLSLF